MPLTLTTTDITASGTTYSGTIPTPFVPAPGPQTATYNSTISGKAIQIRPFVNGPLLQVVNEIPVPTLIDNQAYPGIPSGGVSGGNGGIRLYQNANSSQGTYFGAQTPWIMQVFTDSPASNTNVLSVGRRFSSGAPGFTWLGGVAVSGLSTMESTSVGTASIPGGAYTLTMSRQAPAPLGNSGNALLDMNAGAPGTTAYYVRFEQSGAERGTIWTPGATTTYATSSDYRLKDNITPLDPEEELQRVNELRPRKWNWKNNQDPGIGFIAHELQETIEDATKLGIVSGTKDAFKRKGRIVWVATGEPVSKELKTDPVTGEETVVYAFIEEPNNEEKAELAADGREWVYCHDEPVYQGIDTSFLASSTVAAIQALTARVTELESRVTELESK